jgi:putative hydrolase of the HAD superfamily
MTVRAILFDVDDTLYPRSAGVMGQIRKQILAYMRTRLTLSPEEADALRQRYLREYGTTMRGLQLHHQIEADDYLDFVHNIPLQDYIRPNPALDRALASLPQRKVVFTNASREHAQGVLDVLGVGHHFDCIVDVRDVDFESKPRPAAYQRVCELLDLHPEECVLVEDNVRNLRPAKELGMTTVLVGAEADDAEGIVDYTIACVEEIARVLDQNQR